MGRIWRGEFLLFFLIFLSALLPSFPAARTYYDDENYHNVDRYNMDVKELAAKYSGLVKLEVAGNSGKGDPIYFVRMTDPAPPPGVSKLKKIKIMITFGEHAREFLPVESFFKLVRDLAEGHAKGLSWAKQTLFYSELILVGLVNPDGRRYLEKTKDYCWRGMGNGVDVNRNFPWEYGGPGSSNNPKNEEYRGKEALSEPESRAMKELAENEEITAILSMHTGAQYIFVPYSDTVSKRIRRRHETTRRQISLANVMWAASDGFFTGTGVVYDMNDYTADGTMTDWMAGKLNVPYAITFEMYGTPGDLANCFEQFNPPGNMVQSTLERIHGMYSAAFLYLIHMERGVAPPPDAGFNFPPRMGKEHEWEFHQSVDAPGGDLRQVSLTKDPVERLSQLKEMCGLLPDCAGFSTSGWLKKEIVPFHKFKVWSAGPTDGLYVKKSNAELFSSLPGAGSKGVKKVAWGNVIDAANSLEANEKAMVNVQARAKAVMMEVERQLATARQSSIQYKTLLSAVA